MPRRANIPLALPQSPPTHRTPPVVASPRTWQPTVGAIAAIIFGIIDIASGIYGYHFRIHLVKALAQESTAKSFLKFEVLTTSVCIVGIALGLMLLFGGIGLLRKQPGAVRLLWLWTVSKIVAAVLTLWLDVVLLMEALHASTVRMNPNDPFGWMVTGYVFMLMAIAVAVVFLLKLILPLVMVGYLGRIKVREAVAQWRAARAAPSVPRSDPATD